MKKFIATFWGFAVSAILVSQVFVANAEAQILSQSPLYLKNIALELNSPEAISRYLWKNFRYENDQSHFGTAEYWQSPEEFLATRKGDCEDFALMARELLAATGRKAFVLNIYGDGYAHTICVYVENGKYNAVDGTDLKRYQADDLKALISKIQPRWETAAMADISSCNKGRILKKISK